MFYVYFIRSRLKDFLYVGSTKDLKRRFSEHNDGLVQSTKHYAPFDLEGYVAVKSESHARQLEKYFKTGSGRAILLKRFIQKDSNL